MHAHRLDFDDLAGGDEFLDLGFGGGARMHDGEVVLPDGIDVGEILGQVMMTMRKGLPFMVGPMLMTFILPPLCFSMRL